ncbi:L10-interacting MYB domain-containing protein, partial [Bienertia sinuspersici]
WLHQVTKKEQKILLSGARKIQTFYVKFIANILRKMARHNFLSGKTFNWKLRKKIGRTFNNPNSCKHKYDAMRKDWRNWMALKTSETGLGWDPISGRIEASNELWQKKIKENPEFRKFWQRGVNSVLEEYWEILFGDSYASGENVYYPTMDSVEDRTRVEEYIEEEGIGEEMGYQSNQFQEALLDEENFVDNFVEQAKNYGQSNMAGSSRVTTEYANKHASKVQRQTMTKDVSGQIKRTKRQSAGSAMMGKSISEMAECIKSMSQSSSTNVSTISRALQIISHMVDNFLLEKQGEMWCFANTVIEDATKREIFIKMDDDENRLAWLQFLFDKINN